MARPASSGILLQTTAAALLLAGLWRRDCVLLASAPVVAQRAFLLHMDRGRPWCPLRAATRALTAGAASLVAALALSGHVLAVRLGWWWAMPVPDAWTLACMLVPAVLLVALQRGRDAMLDEAQLWLAMLGGAWIATWPWQRPLIALTCAFALIIAAMMTWSAWGLARYGGSGLLRQAE